MIEGNQLTIPALEEDGLYDCDHVAFHSVFTCLVNFVDEEHGGPLKFKEYVEWCEAEDTNNPEAQRTTFDLYLWYTRGSWQDYFSLYESRAGNTNPPPNALTPHTQLQKAVSVMGCWWT